MPQFTFAMNESAVFINGVEFHLMQDVSGEDSYGLEKIAGIGDIKGWELVPMEATYRVNLSGYVVKTESAVSAGIWPENADAVLDGKEFSIEIFNRKSGALLKKYEKAKCESGTISGSLHRQAMMRLTFQALNTSGTLGA